MTDNTDLPSCSEELSFLEDVITRARRQGADAADAVFVSSQSLSLSWRLGKLEDLLRAEDYGIGLRVFQGQRQAVVSTSDRSRDSLDDLVDRAIAMAKSVPEDPFCGLADRDQIARSMVEVESFDPTCPTPDMLKTLAAQAEDAALTVAGVTNSEGANAGWGASRVCVVASNGFSRSFQRSSSSLSVSVVAGQDQGMERDYDDSTTVFFRDLDAPDTIGRHAGERTVRRLGARRIRTTKGPVIFDPRVARGLIGHFLGAINGASVARGTTFLKDFLGKKVFSEGITVVEDPHLKRGLGSRPIDAEGIPTTRHLLVEDGVLTTWLLDLHSARRLGLTSTGHAMRGISSLPSPAASNVWLEPGRMTPEELIAETGEGLYVTELFGQGVNGVTGDYSRGCTGFWIRNGKIDYPVSEITIAGNLLDMFQSLTPASDLTRRYMVNTPTLRIDGMMVAGE